MCVLPTEASPTCAAACAAAACSGKCCQPTCSCSGVPSHGRGARPGGVASAVLTPRMRASIRLGGLALQPCAAAAKLCGLSAGLGECSAVRNMLRTFKISSAAGDAAFSAEDRGCVARTVQD
jgi:hypothetical protein